MTSVKLLVIEDSDIKYQCVEERLRTELDDILLIVTRARDYESALKSLNDEYFDFVIVDLLLPGAGFGPSFVTSTKLVHMLMRGDLVPPSFVIGLTEFADRAAEVGSVYREYFLALEIFNATEFGWAERIARQIRYMVRARFAAVKFRAESHSLDVLVLTARYEREFLPVRDLLFRGQEFGGRHALIEREVCFGEIRGKEGTRGAAILGVNEVGLAPTASVLTHAISVFRPRLVVMLGMCCGFGIPECAQPRKLGDVIISREVSLWDEAKYVEGRDSMAAGPRDRSKTRMIDDQIREAVAEIVETEGTRIAKALRRERDKTRWREVVARHAADMRETPEVTLSTTVSGSSLIADQEKVREILTRKPGAVGLEMENYAVYTAVDFVGGLKPSKLAIKGVADFGDGNKRDDVQELASTCAAITFANVLDGLIARKKI